MSELAFFAPCPRGLEPLLANELSALGATEVLPTEGGVGFGGGEDLLYRANLQSRIASRILLKVGAAAYRSEDDIYRAAHALAWPDWFDAARTIRVQVAATRSPLRSLDFVTLRVKDAVCDRFRADRGVRPSVATRHPDVRIHAFLDPAHVAFYIDTSGEPLFKRGWRDDSIPAPLRENLAAGILELAGWTPATPLLDPMCGGGTFLIEAATRALGIAPGAGRGFAFERLARYDPGRWRAVREHAEAAREPARALAVHGSDRDPRAVSATRRALERAGLTDAVVVRVADVLDVEPHAPEGVMVMNPPYGVRIGELAALAELYPQLGRVLKQRFAGWRCSILTSDRRLPGLVGLKPSRRTPLMNGDIECRLYQFVMVAGSMRRPLTSR